MDKLRQAAQAVVDKWDKTGYVDTRTADYILMNTLRTALAEPCESESRRPIVWAVDTKSYGTGYSVSDEFLEAFPNFPIPPPSVDALIAEIDGLCGVAAPFATEADGLWVDADELKAITDKYRGQK